MANWSGWRRGERSRNVGGHGHIFNKFPYFPPFFRMISSHFFEKCSRCAVPFSVDLPADCLNYHFYIVHDHTESEKKSRSKNIFLSWRKLILKVATLRFFSQLFFENFSKTISRKTNEKFENRKFQFSRKKKTTVLTYGEALRVNFATNPQNCIF